MVTTSLAKRMRKLRTLLDIRLGPGAAILQTPPTRLHLTFARKINDGHMGPRKFWHTYLPRLKYHNPAVPMTVERTDDQEGPATLSVHFASAPARTGVKDGDAGEEEGVRVKRINMKHKKEGEILEEVLRLCDGRPVLATPAEEEQLRELEGERIRAEEDRVRQEKVLKDRRRQQQILQQAKQSMDT